MKITQAVENAKDQDKMDGRKWFRCPVCSGICLLSEKQKGEEWCKGCDNDAKFS